MPGVLCSMRYPPETHLELKSHEISFIYNTRFNSLIGLKFYKEHGSDTAVLCAQFENDWSTEACVSDPRILGIIVLINHSEHAPLKSFDIVDIHFFTEIPYKWTKIKGNFNKWLKFIMRDFSREYNIINLLLWFACILFEELNSFLAIVL